MEDKDITEQFIRDVRSIDYYDKKIRGIDSRLCELSNAMCGVSSPILDNVVIEQGSNNYQHRLIDNLSMEEKLINDKKNLIKKIEEVAIIINALPTKTRNIVIDVYLLGGKQCEVAKKYNFDRSYMRRKLNKELAEILKKTKEVTMGL